MSDKYQRWLAVFIVICIWILNQGLHMIIHAKHEYPGNPHTFANHFKIIPVTRTNMHMKDGMYWMHWLSYIPDYVRINNKYTLIQMDIHAEDDALHDVFHECSPSQLFQYDRFVIETLTNYEIFMDDMFEYNELLDGNVTDLLSTFGYIDKFVWIFPDHWTNYSNKVVFNVNYHVYRQLIKHHTYFIKPIGGHKYEHFMLNQTEMKGHAFTSLMSDKLFAQELKLINEIPNDDEYLRIDVYAMTLSEWIEISNKTTINSDNIRYIYDIDLDYFVCEDMSSNIMDIFDWDTNTLNKFNDVLSHHHYTSTHMYAQDHKTALLTYINMIIDNNHDSIHTYTDEFNDYYKDIDYSYINIPSIQDIMEYNKKHKINFTVYEAQAILHFLYRIQLESDKEFMDPLPIYLHLHDKLDDIISDIGNDNDGSHVFPYYSDNDYYGADNELKQSRYDWHVSLANEHNIDNAINAEIDSQGHVSLSNNDYGNIIDYGDMDYFLNNIKDHTLRMYDINSPESKYFQWNTKFNKNRNKTDFDLQDYTEQLSVLLFEYALDAGCAHKLTEDVMNKLIAKIDRKSIKLDDCIQYICDQKEELEYDISPDFTDLLMKEKHDSLHWSVNADEFYHMLDVFHIKGNYVYNEANDMIESRKDNESWTIKHIDREKHRLELKANESNIDPNYEYNIHNINDTLHWDKLDPVQKHFIKKANHNRLNNFIKSLTKKQQYFLKWIMVCFVDLDTCENGYHLPLIKREFGDEINWSDIKDLPGIITDGDHQIKIEKIHLSDGISIFDNQHKYIKDIPYIKNNIKQLSTLIGNNIDYIETMSIELSRGHVPKKYWDIECYLMKSINKSIHNNNDINPKRIYIRYQNDKTLDNKTDFNQQWIRFPKCLK